MGIDPRYVYIATDGNLFKIGITKNLLKRQRTLTTAFGRPCFIVAVGSDNNGIARDAERKIKKDLAKYMEPQPYKYREICREWFNCDFDKIYNITRIYCSNIQTI